jgi:hypothetical protein
VADGAGNSLTRLRLLAKNVCPKVPNVRHLGA